MFTAMEGGYAHIIDPKRWGHLGSRFIHLTERPGVSGDGDGHPALLVYLCGQHWECDRRHRDGFCKSSGSLAIFTINATQSESVSRRGRESC
jgi:hypothetical protein